MLAVSILFTAGFAVAITAPTPANAAFINCGNTDTGRLVDQQGNLVAKDRCTFKDLIATAANIVKYLFEGAGVIAVGGIVFGGFQMVASSGNEGMAQAGKKTVTNSLIGLVIVLLSVLIVQSLIGFFGLQGGDPVSNPGGFLDGGQ